jgi:putative endopeptidase
MKRMSLIAFAVAGLCLPRCASTKPQNDADTIASAPAPAAAPLEVAEVEEPRAPFALPQSLPAGLDGTAFDVGVHPCDDFYRFACGTWIDKTDIPADRSSYSRGFAQIADRNEKLLRDLLERAAANKLDKVAPATSKKLGTYWKTCMNEPALETNLLAAQKQFTTFAKVNSGKDVAASVALLHGLGGDALFGSGSVQDSKDASLVIVGVDQGGLTLPDRDYYTQADDNMKKTRAQYLAHLEKMFGLLGANPTDAKTHASDVMMIETRLATASLTNVERRDPQKLYHRLERKGLEAAAPSFDWATYFRLMGITSTAINVVHPPYLSEVEKLVRELKPAQWRAYFTWHYLTRMEPALPKAMQEESFRFVSTALTGQAEDQPRWKKCVGLADAQLGDLVGQAFVVEYFAGDSKAKTLAMVQALEAAFEANLSTLSWMDEATKAMAKIKVQKMRNMIGYPDKWRDYASFTTSPDSFLSNLAAGHAEAVRFDLAKVGKPVDKNEWLMSAPTVNAYNDPQNNQIVFPAGILQPPFFDVNAGDAINFGTMGMVVGHEITHGFDDEGRQFDEAGNLRDWWSAASASTFAGKTKCVQEQFSNYAAVDDIKVKGDLTLGENVADLGGLKISLAALQAWEKTHPPVAGALTSHQQFYLGYAQAWCSKVRVEEARALVAVDPHSPPRWRVNGPLSNLPTFSTAFGCRHTDPMVRAQRCEVW